MQLGAGLCTGVEKAVTYMEVNAGRRLGCGGEVDLEQRCESQPRDSRQIVEVNCAEVVRGVVIIGVTFAFECADGDPAVRLDGI